MSDPKHATDARVCNALGPYAGAPRCDLQAGHAGPHEHRAHANSPHPTSTRPRAETSYLSRPATVLAADADYEDAVRCVVMPCCGFTFDAIHTDHGREPEQYTCPCCAPDRPTRE